MQPLADQRAHKVARLVARLAAAVIIGREIEQRAAADQQIAVARTHGPPVGLVDIRTRSVDRRAGERLAVEQRRIAELAEEALLEAAQYRGRGLAAGKPGERLAIGVEQR